MDVGEDRDAHQRSVSRRRTAFAAEGPADARAGAGEGRPTRSPRARRTPPPNRARRRRRDAVGARGEQVEHGSHQRTPAPGRADGGRGAAGQVGVDERREVHARDRAGVVPEVEARVDLEQPSGRRASRLKSTFATPRRPSRSTTSRPTRATSASSVISTRRALAVVRRGSVRILRPVNSPATRAGPRRRRRGSSRSGSRAPGSPPGRAPRTAVGQLRPQRAQRLGGRRRASPSPRAPARASGPRRAAAA